jgi:hypothetical protein
VVGSSAKARLAAPQCVVGLPVPAGLLLHLFHLLCALCMLCLCPQACPSLSLWATFWALQCHPARRQRQRQQRQQWRRLWLLRAKGSRLLCCRRLRWGRPWWQTARQRCRRRPVLVPSLRGSLSLLLPRHPQVVLPLWGGCAAAGALQPTAGPAGAVPLTRRPAPRRRGQAAAGAAACPGTAPACSSGCDRGYLQCCEACRVRLARQGRESSRLRHCLLR